jgi:hypothetical protein
VILVKMVEAMLTAASSIDVPEMAAGDVLTPVEGALRPLLVGAIETENEATLEHRLTRVALHHLQVLLNRLEPIVSIHWLHRVREHGRLGPL